jgi:transmembrane sensor
LENYQHALYIASLIHKWQEKGSLTETERQDLDHWRNTDAREALFQELTDRKLFVAELRRLSEYDADEAAAIILARLGESSIPHPVTKPPLRRWIAVAAVLLLVVAGIWLLFPRQTTAPTAKKDIAPGGNRATLTLAGGAHILLDTTRSGAIARQGGTDILKLADGRLTYKGADAPATESLNTLSTPRGGQYQLTLSDGSRVWLNAASSITYPAAFTGNQRTVTISGEAYLEVAPDKARPFRVMTGDQRIEVLGTAFDVNAYSDEPAMATTLIEGKIRVGSGAVSKLLAPGEQAKSNGTQLDIIPGADIDQVLAWKNGAFSFRHADLPTVMRQLARWYDIDVEYAGNPPSGTFDGEIGRSLTLSQVLDGLALTHIHYTIVDEHKIIIRP